MNLGPKSQRVLEAVAANPGCTLGFVRHIVPREEVKQTCTALLVLLGRKVVRRKLVYTGNRRLVGNWIYYHAINA